MWTWKQRRGEKMRPRVCFQLLSKCLACSGLNTNQVPLLRYAVPLDYSLSLGWIHKVFSNEKAPKCSGGEMTVMASSCSFNCLKRNEGQGSQLLEGEDQPRTEQQQSSLPGVTARTPCSSASSKGASPPRTGRKRHRGKVVLGRPKVRLLASGFIPGLRASRVGVQSGWPGGASLRTRMSLLKPGGGEVMSSLPDSQHMERCKPSIPWRPSASERRKCPN